MKPGGSMLHSQGLSNNPYPELIPISSRSILILSSHLCLGLPKGLYPVGLPVIILKALLHSSIPAPPTKVICLPEDNCFRRCFAHSKFKSTEVSCIVAILIGAINALSGGLHMYFLMSELTVS